MTSLDHVFICDYRIFHRYRMLESAVTKIARYRVKKKKLSKVKTILEEFVEDVKRNEPGILYYEVFQEKKDPASFVHVIKFKDKLAERSHAKSAHVQKLKKMLYPICKDEPEFTYLKMVKSMKDSKSKPSSDVGESQQ